jgi:hypothetical protein
MAFCATLCVLPIAHVCGQISHIPTIGSDQFFLSYISAWKQLFDDGTLIKEGYYKVHSFPHRSGRGSNGFIQYTGAAFKIPSLTTSSGWMVVVNGQKMVDELRKAPSDVLSFNAATDDVRSLSARVTDQFGL